MLALVWGLISTVQSADGRPSNRIHFAPFACPLTSTEDGPLVLLPLSPFVTEGLHAESALQSRRNNNIMPLAFFFFVSSPVSIILIYIRQSE